MVCAVSKDPDQPAHTRSLIRAFASRLNDCKATDRIVSLKSGCIGSSESTLVKMAHSWKSHVADHIFFYLQWSINRPVREISLLIASTSKMAQASLCICADLPEPSLLAYSKPV